MNCIFCKIINNEVPSYTIYENELVKIFLDINQDSKGHCLIVPKDHTQDLVTIERETLIHIMDKAKEYIRILQSKLNADGITLIQNNGSIQEVKHFHLHLKPYYEENPEYTTVEEVYNILKNS